MVASSQVDTRSKGKITLQNVFTNLLRSLTLEAISLKNVERLWLKRYKTDIDPYRVY